jgi:hypothetical protein
MLPELIFASSDKKENRQVSKLLKEKKIRKIAPRIYTSNFGDSQDSIIRRHIFAILSNLYPNSILSHRSAFEFAPTKKGNIYVTYTYSKKINYPGVTINFIKGPPPTDMDGKFFGELYASSTERKFLENLQHSRLNEGEKKNLDRDELEKKLFDIYVSKDMKGLNDVRDKARKISKILDMEKEFKNLDRIIGAIFTTKRSKLTSPLAIASSFGEPYDGKRLELFNELFISLKKLNTPDRPDLNKSQESYKNFAFFEAYFSNYIEGTKFTLDEAIKIIDTHIPLPARNEDSHDVIGTYDIVSRRDLMSITPKSDKELIELLKQRHLTILINRPDKNPGVFKTINNQAGDTLFVDYKLVKGTLKKGFELYTALDEPFSKAAFMMFMIAEVHPFDDGNGRIARIMMNAELTKKGQSKILIPNVYRIDYLVNLKNLTKQSNTKGYIEMLDRIHRFSLTINSDDRDQMKQQLENANAFKTGEEHVLKF